ncbi:hypothetical protein D3C72_1734210 [compost metagenome]
MFRLAQRQAVQRAGCNERLQQVDRGDADDRHRQLYLQHAGVDVAQPFRLVRVAFQAQARDEGFIAADDHHHQQVGDHHHIDQAQHDQHDLLLAHRHRVRDQVPQFLAEQEHVNALGNDQTQVQRQLQPAGSEDQAGQRGQ